METRIFDSELLPDGHLTCPAEFIQRKNVQFKVLAIFEKSEREASDQDIEVAALQDNSDDFLLPDEVQYYMSLKDP